MGPEEKSNLISQITLFELDHKAQKQRNVNAEENQVLVHQDEVQPIVFLSQQFFFEIA